MIKLSDRELERLALRVEEDYNRALPDHQRRMSRFKDAYRRWRNRVEPPPAGQEDRPNLQVPVTQWNVFGKWAKMMQSLLGEGAEVIAEPVGESDYKQVHKIGRFATWAFLHNIRRAVSRYALFTFRTVLFGVGHSYRPWCREENETGQVNYEGVDFLPLWPDDLIVPAEDAETIQDFSYVIRKFRLSPDALLRGEAEGRYSGIKNNFERIVRQAQNGGAEQRDNDMSADAVKAEKDEAEGVTYDGYQSAGELLMIHEWFGRWRMPKGKDAGDDQLKGRDLRQTELVVYFIPSLRLVIGVDKLNERYPIMKNKRPFAEAHLVKDGSYWNAGAAELLRDIEDEVSSTRNLSTEAMKFGVAPVVFYEAASGYKPKEMPLGPGMGIPVASVAGIHVVNMSSDLSGPVAAEQALLGYGERVFGVSDQALGRAIDRPNAPRTAAGQMLLAEQGDVRVWLDVAFLRDDFSEIFRDMWEMWSEFGPDGVFFRVTEEDSKGLFETQGGGAKMTAEEFGGRYDFTIKFATSAWGRQAERDNALARYQLDLTNPLIASNPRALWNVTREAHRALGDPNFADMVPEPPDIGIPKSPREEWVMLEQGEDIHVSPMDNDDLHLVDHYRRLEEETDPDARQRGAIHIVEHQKQKRTKMLMSVMASKVAEGMQQDPAFAQMVMQGQGGGPGGPAGPGAPPAPPMPMLGGGGAPPMPPGMPQMGAPPAPPMGGPQMGGIDASQS